MKKIIDFVKSYLLEVFLIVLALVTIIMITVHFKAKNTIETVEAKVKEKVEKKEETIEEKIETIKVDVKGSVINPGVYELEANARVNDAILLAGGFLENANTKPINLSKKLEDEMVIIVYSNEEVENYKNGNKITEYVYIEIEKCPDTMNNACINSNQKEENTTSKDSIQNASKMISINQATLEELITLPSIGESKAQAIIEYRNKNGNFKTIDDILNVSGIGNSVFEKIKDSITV